MTKVLLIVSMASIVALSGCQSSQPAPQPKVAAAAHNSVAIWDTLVLSDDIAHAGFEANRNDAVATASPTETPDFVDRRWLLTRQYENLRVTNGQPGEYSSTVTRTIIRGPGR